MGRPNLIRLSLHIGDYLRHTRQLRTCEHGAYLMLIMHYWSNGGLPENDDQLATITSMSSRDWRKHKPTIVALFETGWKLPWLDAAIADALIARERKSVAGKKGNDVRWRNRHGNADRQAFGDTSHCDRNAIAPQSPPLATCHHKESEPVSYTHLTLPTNREV